MNVEGGLCEQSSRARFFKIPDYNKLTVQRWYLAKLYVSGSQNLKIWIKSLRHYWIKLIGFRTTTPRVLPEMRIKMSLVSSWFHSQFVQRWQCIWYVVGCIFKFFYLEVDIYLFSLVDKYPVPLCTKRHPFCFLHFLFIRFMSIKHHWVCSSRVSYRVTRHFLCQISAELINSDFSGLIWTPEAAIGFFKTRTKGGKRPAEAKKTIRSTRKSEKHCSAAAKSEKSSCRLLKGHFLSLSRL